ncbi:MAG: sigma-70 family RNA polymerase sigma factor [Agathobacter sp.]|nr:sigma-70 family RNA polymerase sigma factor [Agathobacter sp.]
MEELFKENAKLLYSYLYSLCHNESLAEELTQQTFYKACLSIDRYDNTCKFSTWLCQIGKHTYYQYLEKNKRIAMTDITEELSVTEISAERQALSRIELLETLRQLHTLPQDMREVIYLRSFGDLSFREIGDIMGKSENWARVTYFRGKTKLIELSGHNET